MSTHHILESLQFYKGSLTDLQYSIIIKALQCKICHMKQLYENQMKLDLQSKDYDKQYFSIVRFARAICQSRSDVFLNHCSNHEAEAKELLYLKKISDISKQSWGIASYLQSKFDDYFLSITPMCTENNESSSSHQKSPRNMISHCKKLIPYSNATATCLKKFAYKNAKKSVRFDSNPNACVYC